MMRRQWWGRQRVIYLYTHTVIYIICVYDKIVIIIILGRYIIQNQQGLIPSERDAMFFISVAITADDALPCAAVALTGVSLALLLYYLRSGIIACIYYTSYMTSKWETNDRFCSKFFLFFEYLVFLKRTILLQSRFDLSTTTNPIPDFLNLEGNHDSWSGG